MGFFFLSNPFTVMVFSYPISSCSCSSYYLWVLKKAKLLDDMKHVGALVLLGESVYLIILLRQFLMNSRRSISLDSWLRRKLCCPHSLRNLNSTWWYLMFRWCYHQMLFIGEGCVPVFIQLLVICSPVWLWLPSTCKLMLLILVGSLFFLFVS